MLKITGLPFKGGNRSAGFVDITAGICQGDQWGIAPVGGTFCEIVEDVDYLSVYERGTTAIGVSIAANVAAGTDFYINITYMTDDA